MGSEMCIRDSSHPPQRFVTSVDSPSGGTPEPSSWCYPDEIPINDEESNAYSSTRATTPSHVTTPRFPTRDEARSVTPRSSCRLKAQTRTSRLLNLRGRSVFPGALAPTILKSTHNSQHKKKGSSKNLEAVNFAFKHVTPTESEEEISEEVSPSIKHPMKVETAEVNGHSDQFNLDVRLRLIERQLQDVKPSNLANLSAVSYTHLTLPTIYSV